MADNRKKIVKKDEISQKHYLKNYLILGIIFICCFGLTIYFCKWYDVYKEYQREIPVIRGSLMEIRSDELDHYLVDNPNIIIYICTAYSDACRNYEKDFKKYISKNDITDEIIYLNLTNDDEMFLDSFNKKHPYRVKLKNQYPAFVVFNEGVVESILQSNSSHALSISRTQHFLELYLIEDEEYVMDDESEKSTENTLES